MADRSLSRRLIWIASIAGAMVLFIAAALAYQMRTRPLPVQTAMAEHRDLAVPILADGSLEPPPGSELRAPVSATVAAILVREGQTVEAGAPLLRLVNPQLETSALAARSQVQQLRAEKAVAEFELQQARTELEHLRQVVASDERLLSAGAITRQERDRDLLALRAAEERLQSAQSRIRALSDGLSSQLGLAERSARQLEQQASTLTVAAPVGGIVYNLPSKAGETVEPGKLIATVADPRHLRVRIRVDQPDLPRIKVGQKIVVTFDGLPDSQWDGTILLVPPGVRELGGREVGEVIGEISDSTAALPPNASVNVRIIVGEKLSALVIPRGALHREGEQRYVFVLRDGRARRTAITVGLIGTTEVEITSGIGEGDEVILPASTPLGDGMRVDRKAG